MPELLVTLEAMAKVEKRKNKFMAALQGVDIDKDQEDQQGESNGPATIEEVQARAVARITGDKNLAGAHAAGITPDMGLEYKISEGTGIG
jgi:hypothetical protein